MHSSQSGIGGLSLRSCSLWQLPRARWLTSWGCAGVQSRYAVFDKIVPGAHPAWLGKGGVQGAGSALQGLIGVQDLGPCASSSALPCVDHASMHAQRARCMPRAAAAPWHLQGPAAQRVQRRARSCSARTPAVG